MLPTVVACVVAYLAGWFGLQWFASILWVVLVGLFRYHVLVEQEHNEEHTNTVLQRFESASVVRDDDWLNSSFTLWWNAFVVREHVVQWIADFLDDTLDFYKPAYLTSIHVHKLLLGRKPPVLRRVCRLPNPEGSSSVLAYEVDVTYFGGAKLILMASMAKVMNIPIELDQIALFGKVHLYFSLNPVPEGKVPKGYSMSTPENVPPLSYGPGYFRDMSASFVERPTVTFNVRALNMVNLLEMPGIKTWLRKLLAEDIMDLYSLPNSFYLSFEEGIERCQECEYSAATLFCDDCLLRSCDRCSALMHSKGRRKEHHVVPLSARQTGAAAAGDDSAAAVVGESQEEATEAPKAADSSAGAKEVSDTPRAEEPRSPRTLAPTASSPRKVAGTPDGRELSLTAQILDKLSIPFPKLPFRKSSETAGKQASLYESLSDAARGETRRKGAPKSGTVLTFGAILANIEATIADIHEDEYDSISQAFSLAEALDPDMDNADMVKADLELSANRHASRLEARTNEVEKDLDIVHQTWRMQSFDSRLIGVFEASEIKKLKGRVDEMRAGSKKLFDEKYSVFTKRT